MHSVNIYQHHDDEFGIVIYSGSEEEINFLYIPSRNMYIKPEYGNEYSELIDLLTDQEFEGEPVNDIMNQIQTYFEGWEF
jgi:hypothetical protein